MNDRDPKRSMKRSCCKKSHTSNSMWLTREEEFEILRGQEIISTKMFSTKMFTPI